MSAKDIYSRENIIAAINLVGARMTAAEKRKVLKAMTADVERLTVEAKEFLGSDAEKGAHQLGEDHGR